MHETVEIIPAPLTADAVSELLKQHDILSFPQAHLVEIQVLPHMGPDVPGKRAFGVLGTSLIGYVDSCQITPEGTVPVFIIEKDSDTNYATIAFPGRAEEQPRALTMRNISKAQEVLGTYGVMQVPIQYIEPNA